ncbi:hypothetical protein PsalMR5_00898 [Piscirickettsia salmonis]|uniref:hypothetical protein n=1 Tax=Piscirickettsia salmonis TaxID=1238 RepID=UPI0012BB18E7|nr:hypothetical protein [Piscirickettsia salmonis]QGP53484.1 hypothetical protein PsalSR1_00897 [Piscirickettsia salmonis]QGP63052.1 hypothetical protein PsalMR5_00898 [Piscirickettsia salmonis]
MRTATVTNLVIYIFTYLTYITSFFYYFFIHNTISYSRNIIYTWQDTQGILSFSNHAHPNATTLELPSPVTLSSNQLTRKRRYLGRYFAHPMMQNRRAKRDDYKSSAVRVTQRYVP